MIKYLKNELYHFFFFLIVLAGFVALSIFSMRHEQHSYPISDNAEIVFMLDHGHVRHTRVSHKQAKALKDVWQLTDADIAAPVNIWGSGEK